MRLIHAIKYDILFQFRHGFYYAYLFLSLVYIMILQLLPDSITTKATIIIILTDPSVLGAFFIGALFMLERQQNILESLFVTPFKINEYLFSKILSLTLISLTSSLLISIFGATHHFNLFLFCIGVIYTSLFFTMFGFTLAIFSKTINQYFLYSILSVIFVVPIVSYLNLFSTPLFYLFPFQATIFLIDGSFHHLSFPNFSYAFLYLNFWCIIIYYLLKKVFYQKMIVKAGN